jgi:propionate CoA-transferase
MGNPFVSKLLEAEDATALVADGMTLAVDGFVGAATPEELLRALEARFLDSGAPRDLTVIAATGQGDAQGRGLDRLAHAGLIRRLITSYLNLNRALQKRLIDDEFEGYLLPLGVIVQLYREIAAGRPGLITHIGLNTFVDPRQEGGRVNARTVDDLVEVVTLAGKEWLFYPSMKLDIGFLRGTTADEDGNITMEREIATFQGPSFAQAVRNAGGTVIAQVERVVERGTLNPREVVIPGHLIDHVVLGAAENHRQTFASAYNPLFSGEARAEIGDIAPVPLDTRKLIGRRAAMELQRGDVVNLGVGIAGYVATVAREEECGDAFTLTVESGATGGYPAYNLDFGASINAGSVIDHTYQFDFYDGGGLDITIVGLAQMDAAGNVNVSKLAHRIPGVGGFFNVTQGAERVVFCGLFTAGDQEITVTPEGLRIDRDGAVVKFVEQVEQVTFNAQQALAKGQRVTAMTERGVFEITDEGPVLTEIAPGVDLERDIIARMGFRPAVSPVLAAMPAEIFRPGRFDLARYLNR